MNHPDGGGVMAEEETERSKRTKRAPGAKPGRSLENKRSAEWDQQSWTLGEEVLSPASHPACMPLTGAQMLLSSASISLTRCRLIFGLMG